MFLCMAILKAGHIDFVDKSLYYYHVPQNWSKYDIKNYNTYAIMYFNSIEKVLTGKNKRLKEYVKLRCLLERLSTILNTYQDYKEKIDELYKISFYKQARKLKSLLHLIVYDSRSIKSKLASICLYFGMYNTYLHFVKSIKR